MSSSILLWLVLVPAIFGALCLVCVGPLKRAQGPVFILGAAANLVLAIMVFRRDLSPFEIPFGTQSWQLLLSLRIDAFSSFIVISAASLSFLIALYAERFLRGRSGEESRAMTGPFLAFFLFTVALLEGAVLADHLVTLLFFGEGMLLTLFGMIALGGVHSFKTAVKAFAINGATDLCLMAGVGLIFSLRHQLNMSNLSHHPLPVEGWGGVAFVLLLIGAVSKAGAMPFHSWIPDAATDAPLPFMALLPGGIEKLLGIYLTARVSLDLFKGVGDSWAGTLMMVIGAVTIMLAVLMALVQKDFKRLLSFHAISQVGYMILGLGTGTAIGAVGALFHMVNNSMYKSTLFLTGGAVEQQAGTTDLKKISGLGRVMPITMGCFLIAAFSISGFPLTNGFYSKELVYDAALERGVIYYAAAALGSFFTAASFLKLGHAAFFGPYTVPKKAVDVRDPSLPLLVPMAIIAVACLVFGLGNTIPIDMLIKPGLPAHMAKEAALVVSGPIPHTWGLVGITVVALTLATLNHFWGAKRTGSGLGAVDHIHYAPVAHQLYDAAERRWFDPYEWAMQIIYLLARIGWAIDRGIDFLYNRVATTIAGASAGFLRVVHNGSYATYLVWLVIGAEFIVIIFARGI